MSQEIMFRARLTADKEWVYFNIEDLWYRQVSRWQDGACITLRAVADIEDVGRFAGLKDKNGVDVCEGDIVSYLDINDERCTSEVFWYKKFAGFNPWVMSEGITNVRVVGNIYENPKLLEPTP